MFKYLVQNINFYTISIRVAIAWHNFKFKFFFFSYIIPRRVRNIFYKIHILKKKKNYVINIIKYSSWRIVNLKSQIKNIIIIIQSIGIICMISLAIDTNDSSRKCSSHFIDSNCWYSMQSICHVISLDHIFFFFYIYLLLF